MLNYSVWYVVLDYTLDYLLSSVSCQPLSVLSWYYSMIHLITVISVFLLEVVRRSVSHSLLKPHMLKERPETDAWSMIKIKANGHYLFVELELPQDDL